VGLWDLCGYWTPPSSSLPSFELTVLNECAERALRQLAIQGNLEPGKICFFERELCVMCAVSHSVWLVCESEFCHEHPGELDVRGRSDFSRFDPRPERPHFSNFGPPAERRPSFVERRPFCETLPAVGL